MHRSIDPDAIGFLLTDLARLLRAEFDRRIATSGIGLTAGEARTLAHIARAEGERQSVIAERLNVEAMTLSSMIDRLEARGLVARETDPADRRAKCVRLTEEADETMAKVTAIAREVSADAARGIDPAEWKRLVPTLKAARANILEVRANPASESDAA
ncbi:MAG: winged helix DNA-binding protein [Rhizobiaceae bacterium]|nr:winged helix DNA-binding protein [Rhizobiaceae bacterium]